MNKFCLVVSLSAPWFNHPRKHFIEAIAETIEKEGGYVLCLEPTILSIHTLLVYPERIIGWLKGKFKFRKADSNIYVVPAHTIEHILLSVRFKPLMTLNNLILKQQINNALNKIDKDIKDIILFLHRPELYYLVGALNEKGVIYDCCDDYCLTSQMGQLKVLGNEKREKMLAEKSNFIVTSAELLYNRNVKYNKNTFMMENGFRQKYFRKNTLEQIQALENLKKPIIGYIGNLKHWLDYELIEYLVSSRPKWTFVFAGEVRKEAEKQFTPLIEKYKNIVSIGWIHYSQFPNYLKYFDVGIIPFYSNAFMDSANPNKLYDYLGAAIPVVATNIGDLKKDYSDIVKVADYKEEFLKNIESILNLSPSERHNLIQKILNHPKRHSWEESAEFLFDMIKKNILN
jgi:hypothetical protein